MKRIPRRDRCALYASRAFNITTDQAAHAWYVLTMQLSALGEKDIPKFTDLLTAYRRATISALNSNRQRQAEAP